MSLLAIGEMSSAMVILLLIIICHFVYAKGTVIQTTIVLMVLSAFKENKMKQFHFVMVERMTLPELTTVHILMIVVMAE
jgi:hypothetical protein